MNKRKSLQFLLVLFIFFHGKAENILSFELLSQLSSLFKISGIKHKREVTEELKKIQRMLPSLGSFCEASLSHQPLSNGFKLLPVRCKY